METGDGKGPLQIPLTLPEWALFPALTGGYTFHKKSAAKEAVNHVGEK